MTYNGNGFYNKRSGTWVSAAHANQHVGETVNGWTKCYSKSTGNYYMAPSSDNSVNYLSMFCPQLAQLNMYDMYLDMFDPSRAQAKQELLTLAEELSRSMYEYEKLHNEFNLYLDQKIGGHDFFQLLSDEGRNFFTEVPTIDLPYDYNYILQFIQNSFTLGINFYPQMALSNARNMVNANIEYSNKINEKLVGEFAANTGYQFIRAYKYEVYECCCDFNSAHGFNIQNLDYYEPYFWKCENSRTFTAGVDIPVGEFYFQRINDKYNISISTDGEKLLYIKGSGCYTTVNKFQSITVYNARFALNNLLKSNPEENADSGVWKVGSDLVPGKYLITSKGPYGWFYIGESSTKFDSNYINKKTYVHLKKGEYLFLEDAEANLVS